MATDTRRTGRFTFPWFVWAGGAVVLVAAAAFAWWTISPLFINTSVDEAFPTSAAISEAQPAAGEAMAEQPAEGEAMADGEAMAEQPAEGEAMADEAMADEAMADEAMADEAMAEQPAEPVALSVGSFTTIDSLHGASGTATIYRLPEGNLVLRLEEFAAQNGPDLYVGLSGHPMPRSSAEVHDSGYLQLDRLKANQGNQNYELPADIDLSQYKSVVIYCRAFSVVFSTAELGS